MVCFICTIRNKTSNVVSSFYYVETMMAQFYSVDGAYRELFEV